MDVSKLLLYTSMLVAFFIPVGDAANVSGIGSSVKIAGYLNLVVFIVYVGLNKKLLFPKIFVLVLLFVMWNTLTVLWSNDAAASIVRVVTYIQLVILIVSVYNSVKSREDLESVMLAYVIGSTAASLNLLRNFATGSSGDDSLLRYSYEGFDPNDFALFSIIALYFLLFISKVNRFKSIFSYTASVILIFCIILSGSRAMALSLIPFMIAFVFSEYKIMPIRSILAVIGLVFSAIFLLKLIPTGILSRLYNIGSELQYGTLASRRLIWDDGIEIFVNHFILGTGSGAFRASIVDIGGIDNVAHNTYLSIAVETGLIGLILFFIVQVLILSYVFKIRSSEKIKLLFMLISINIGIASLTWEYRKPYWLAIIITILISIYQSKVKPVNLDGRTAEDNL